MPKEKSRVEHVLGKYAIRTIQSAADDAMYATAVDAAVYMATAGFLGDANEVLNRLWSYGWPHSRDCWLADRGLTVLWHTANGYPSSIPFAPEPIDRIELAHREYMAVDRWVMPLPTAPWNELDGLALLRRSMSLAYPRSWSRRMRGRRMPPPEDEIEALLGLNKYIAGFNEPNGYNFGVATCLATELAARNGRIEQAVQSAVRWAEGYPTYWTNYSFECMASNRHMAPLLLQGILAEALGLSEESCQHYRESLLLAVDKRMAQGRSLVYGKWTWARLLAAISKWAIKAEPELYTQEQRRSRWLGHPPASEDAIAAVQERLRVKLPGDYLAFVRVSNGFSATSTTSPRLLPIEEVGFLRDAIPPESFNTYKSYPGDDIPLAMESCILASDRDAEEMVLLIPPLQPEGKWQTWFFAHWIPGETRYSSFRHYLEQELQDLSAGV